MKRQWLAAGLVFLGVSLQSPPAIANSMRNANIELRTMLCTQNWNGSIRAIDKLKSLTSDQRQEMNYLRAILVNLRDQDGTIPEWPDVEYCSSTGEILPEDLAANNAQVGDFTPPANTNTATEVSTAFVGEGTAVSQEQLQGIWYTEAVCKDPAFGDRLRFQITSEYKQDQQYVDKMYMAADMNFGGDSIAFTARMTSAGNYSINGNRLSKTVQSSSASYDTAAVNGETIISPEMNQALDQYAAETIAGETVGQVSEELIRFTPDGKLDVEFIPGCDIDPAYQVVSPLF